VLSKTVHPSISLPWPGIKVNVYGAEVRVCDDLINRTQETIVPGQLFLSGAQFDVTVSRVFMRREDTSNNQCDYVQYIQSANKSPPYEQEVLKKEYSEVTIEKCYNWQNLISLRT
jgi:hypothetical protein